MTIEEFTNSYSVEYNNIFHPVAEVLEPILKEEKPELKVIQPKKTTLSKISSFLFEPRYEVNNLQFKSVGE